MSSRPAEFAHFRFVRDRIGKVLPLQPQIFDEKVFLALDCDRWALARLHIFPKAALHDTKLSNFQAEFALASLHRDIRLSRLLSWGRDGEELFYADEMCDGEPLVDYLSRSSAVPSGVVGEWLSWWGDLFLDSSSLPLSFQQFTTQNFRVTMDPGGRIRLVFSEFFTWMKHSTQVSQSPMWHLAQVFSSLVGGVPMRTFTPESLPRRIDELDATTRADLSAVLANDDPISHQRFAAALHRLALDSSLQAHLVSLPHLHLRDWLAHDLALPDTGRQESDFLLSELQDPEEEIYGVPHHIRGSACTIQILPGKQSIPREQWLNQHHEVTRRPGRSVSQQLKVTYIEDRGALTLIGEERMEGVDLAALIHHTGRLSTEVAAIIMRRAVAALDRIESHVGSRPVWWLPPENILFPTGSRSPRVSANLSERKGLSFWEEGLLKLRLHQTTATLQRGVCFPPALRFLSQQPGRGLAKVRRSSIALPLVYTLLANDRFDWFRPILSHHFEKELTPLIERLESLRQHLCEDPESVDIDLFTEFRQWLQQLEDNESAPETALTGDSDTKVTLKSCVEEVDTLIASSLLQGEWSGFAPPAHAPSNEPAPPAEQSTTPDITSSSPDSTDADPVGNPFTAAPVDDKIAAPEEPLASPSVSEFLSVEIPPSSAAELPPAPLVTEQEPSDDAPIHHLDQDLLLPPQLDPDSPSEAAPLSTVSDTLPLPEISERPALAPPAASTTRPRFSSWLSLCSWSAILGGICAAVFGYYAKGWSNQLGEYPTVQQVTWPAPSYERTSFEDEADVRADMARYLMDLGGIDEIPFLKSLGDKDKQSTIDSATAALEQQARQSDDGHASDLLARWSFASNTGRRSALDWWQNAADAGVADGMFRLAEISLLEPGQEGQLSPDAAMATLKKSADLGHPLAQEMWAVLNAEKAPAEAWQQIQAAARQGNPAAVYQKGLFLAQGIGVAPNTTEAVADLRFAAEQGHIEAMYLLGQCLETGTGAPVSAEEAGRWMKKAAGFGHASAQAWCQERGHLTADHPSDSSQSGGHRLHFH